MPNNPQEAVAELLPCPFCGAKDGQLVQGFTRATDNFEFWSVECIGCGAEIASDTSQAEADAHWNRRLAMEAAEAYNARLREALNDCADALARFAHSTLLDEKHVQARAAIHRAYNTLAEEPDDV